ncbi:MAG: DNA polymerase III subunit gamma/tau [Flavobacteriaceae bacterium]|nr:DNA polymerase III subunit gamma/tau [Flavobacteriaceae bacterium]
MEHFIVSARKYRPQVFEDVIGQETITNTLENAIKNNHLAQALLFTGPRGVGKTTCARILAKRINQESMQNLSEDEDFAFNIFELDAASNNSVDDIRSLTDQVRIPPQVGKYKVYIIDEVHMLSQSAFNAFLKTLEEPPAHAIFILATTEKHKIIPTILSRCQIFDFKRIVVNDIKNYLKKIAKEEQIAAEDDALHIIAQKADGALRDALSIYDRVVSFCGKELTRQAVAENLNVLDYEVYFTVTDIILENKIPELLLEFNSILGKGFDAHHFIIGLASHFRDLLVAKTPSTITLLEVGENTQKTYIDQAKKSSESFLLKAIEIANTGDLRFKESKNQRLLIELTLMQLASITFDGEKKNDSQFIIPASFFKKSTKVQLAIDQDKSVAPVIATEEKIYSTEKKELLNNTDAIVEEQKQPTIQKPNLKLEPRRTSALSISNIDNQKEVVKKNLDFVDESLLPRDEFTTDQLVQLWNEFSHNQLQSGRKLKNAVLTSSLPSCNANKINYQVASKNMKEQFLHIAPHLLKFLKERLNNYDITFNVEVLETIQNKYAHTPKEKYELLSKKNIELDLLRERFKLEL